MAENVTIARPYAEAAFQLARQENALAGWAEAIERMVTIAAHPEMRACVENPRLLDADLEKLVLTIAGDQLGATQQNFIRVLIANDRLLLLPEIRDLFIKLKNDFEGSKKALITSAFPMAEATQQQLIADLERRFNCQLQATVTVDPELIGGVSIAVGDQVIDASVRGKLAQMATALQN